MRLLRAFVICSLVVVGGVTWEICRDDVCNLFKKSDVIKKSQDEVKEVKDVKVNNDVVQQQVLQAPQIIQDEQKQEKDRQEEISATQNDPKLFVNMRDGFSKIVEKALPSVVSIATMHVVKIPGGKGFMDGMFEGTPFSEMFKGMPGFSEGKTQTKTVKTLGSGFCVAIDKEHDRVYIATNYHIVEKAKKIIVILHNRVRINAEIHGVDKRTDIAVLSIKYSDLVDSKEEIQPLKFGDSDKLKEGHFVLAIGNPFGLGSSVSFGIVSRRNSDIGGDPSNPANLVGTTIQHDAAINSGNSGGCLLNIDGEVVGINNAIITCNGGHVGVGFAIPSNIVLNVVKMLIKDGRTYRGWLGISVINVGLEQAISVGLAKKNTVDSGQIYGYYVSDVSEKGPSNGKVLQGDIITGINGNKISSKNTLQVLTSELRSGEEVSLQIWRCVNGKWNSVDVKIKLGDYDEASNKGWIVDSDENEENGSDDKTDVKIPELNISVAPIPQKERKNVREDLRNSIMVTNVDDSNSILSFIGPLFMPGDIIKSFNNVKISSCKQLQDEIKNVHDNQELRNTPIPVEVWRGGSLYMIAVTLQFDDKAVKKQNDSESSSDTEQ